MPLIERIVSLCSRNAVLTVLLALLLGVGAGFYTQSHFAMNTDEAKLISADVPWRQTEIRFDTLFPQQSNLILVVIDGVTPELAEHATNALTAKLATDKALFPLVSTPGGGDFFNHNGMLY